MLFRSGGRVLCIVSRGATLAEARDIAYREMTRISFDGIYCRGDIGLE